MHVVFRESHGLEETAAPFDPGQDPADMLVLSFSDSDLGAFGAGWHRASGTLPSLRLCNLIALRHPVSVDTYIERTALGAKAILVRLIGGGSLLALWPCLSFRSCAQVGHCPCHPARRRARGCAVGSAFDPADFHPTPLASPVRCRRGSGCASGLGATGHCRRALCGPCLG